MIPNDGVIRNIMLPTERDEQRSVNSALMHRRHQQYRRTNNTGER